MTSLLSLPRVLDYNDVITGSAAQRTSHNFEVGSVESANFCFAGTWLADRGRATTVSLLLLLSLSA